MGSERLSIWNDVAGHGFVLSLKVIAFIAEPAQTEELGVVVETLVWLW